MSEEQQPRPTSIDELLKQMLLDNPSLMADLKKSIPADPSQPKQPREKKAPSKDFFLQVYSGCETCHAITITTYNMKWDVISGVFRPKAFCLKDSVTADSEIKTQSLTSSTCASCHAELAQLEKHELINLLVSLQNPEAGIIRLVELKRKLRRLEK